MENRMKSALYCPNVACSTNQRLEKPMVIRAAIEEPLLREIDYLGGEERMRGAKGALRAFESALAQLVREDPKAYGAGNDAVSQKRIVSQLLDSVSNSFLARTVETLRRQAGYVNVCGHWIHRAVFTFIGFGFLTAAVLPFCVVSLLSTAPWAWLPGAFGMGLLLLAAAWILSRVRDSHPDRTADEEKGTPNESR